MAQPREFNDFDIASNSILRGHSTYDDQVPSSHHDQHQFSAISSGEGSVRNIDRIQQPNLSHQRSHSSVRQLPNGYLTWSPSKPGSSQNQDSFNPYYNSLSKQRFPSSRLPNPGKGISSSSATSSEPLYPASDNNSSHNPVESTTRQRHQMVTVTSSTRPSSLVEDIDDDIYEGQVHAVRRLSGACRYCKKLKTKCDFIVEFNMCRRCKAKGQVCIFEGRKKTEHKHEVLIAQLRDKEATIDTLLEKIKSRNVMDANRSTELPPNKEMQNWIKNLYERFPSDPDNNWNEPLLNKVEWSNKHILRYNPAGVELGSNWTDILSQTINIGGEKHEGSLPSVHPLLTHHLPSIRAPIGFIADIHMRKSQATPEPEFYEDDLVDDDRNHDDEEDFHGIADPDYFYPGPAIDIDQRRFYIEREALPDMLLHGLITLNDVDELFKMCVYPVLYNTE
ncbi:hypothetical protein Clacol_008704 [Clathrus columnatus]|uniref:Zn(2)-C6 fungal-type domain-containing protein n=1 Tax=Clathrus columnatus TaxID=1419009 RepID=A0AAV5ARD5_9AGAM|nr:hypothetical protein Clacol_008704 [Clathrus columnatus]